MTDHDNAAQRLALHVESFAQMSPSRSYKKQFSPSPYAQRSWERASVSERAFAYETARQCVEEGLSLRGKDLQHARYFAFADFKQLKEALPPSSEGDCSVSATSIKSLMEDEADTASSFSVEPAQSEVELKQRSTIWKRIKKKLSSESIPSAPSSPSKIAAVRSSQSEKRAGVSIGQLHEEVPISRSNSLSVEKSMALLLMAAPNKGDVIHWIWLIRAFMTKCSICNVEHMLSYLARVQKSFLPEEVWLKTLAIELKPILNYMRESQLSQGSQVMVRQVADRCMQICHEAIRDFRSYKSSKLDNAALLSAAMQLQMLVTKCASNQSFQDMAGVFEEQLASAAQRRYHSLVSTSCDDAGLSSPTAGPQDVAERSMASTTAVCEQLVQDICDDEECYQALVPAGCSICLAEVSCRTYSALLKPELSKLTRQQLNTDRNFFELFHIVHTLQGMILGYAPGAQGPEKCFSNHEGRPVFLPHVAVWMQSVRAKLMQWSMRLLKEEVWQHAVISSSGARCSPSLVELFRALCSVTEENACVSAAHLLYAGLMERTLGKVVLVHVAGLERLCQAEMPSKSGRNLSGQLRSLGSRTHRDFSQEPFQPSTTLCMLLNDLREIRSRQADLGGLLKGMIEPQWWGAQINGGNNMNAKLGDRFRVCQVEIERRYSAVLHHVVKKMMEVLQPHLVELLTMPTLQDSDSWSKSSLVAVLRLELDRLAGFLDVRVQKRISKELWNSLAGVLHDNLLACQEGKENSKYHSLGNVAPHVEHIDSLLKFLSDEMIKCKSTSLANEEPPEKVFKLRKMLSLFLRADEGVSLESL